MKKIIPIAIILLVFLGIFLLMLKSNRTTENILSPDIALISYNNGNAALGINFLKTKTDRYKLSMAIDSDNNGIFEADEWLVDNILVLPKENKKNKVYFVAPENFTDEQNVTIQLNEETLVISAAVTVNDLGELMDLETITNPEEAMKGLGINLAIAKDDNIEITQDNVPDINQKRGECAPTAAANGLISLINQHGNNEDKSIKPAELIEELKEAMDWNIENGVQPDNFVKGKNLWAVRHGLPIKTTKVGDTHGIETLDPIREALANGGSVELRIKFADADGKSVGGHMVTVTGIHQGDGQTYLDINDPYTDATEGGETIEVRSNQITNYGPWKGITVLSWGFTQIWETPLSSGTELEEMTNTETEGVMGEFGDKEIKSTIQTSFKHVKPGEYSEIYAAVTALPDTEITLSLDGDGVVGPKRQIIETDNNGQAYFVWKINSYGTYTISGNNLNSTIVVN